MKMAQKVKTPAKVPAKAAAKAPPAAKAKAKTAAKPATKTAPAQIAAAAAPAAARTVNPALMKLVRPSAELGAVIGTEPKSRPECIKRVWAYIKAHNLQNPANKREIIADAALKPVFGGATKLSMFQVTKEVSRHLHA